MSLAENGQGATISISTDGSTFTEVGEVKSFGGIGSGSSTIKDVTHLKSLAKEKRLGLKDEGQVTLGGNYVELDAGQILMQSARDASTSLSMKVELANSKGVNGTTWEFDVYVQTFKIDGISVDETVVFDASCEITGSVTKTEAA